MVSHDGLKKPEHKNQIKSQWHYEKRAEQFNLIYMAVRKVKVVPMHAMKAYRGVQVQLHLFLTSALHWGERSTSHNGHATSQEGTLTPTE
jgi:hypothetical protein